MFRALPSLRAAFLCLASLPATATSNALSQPHAFILSAPANEQIAAQYADEQRAAQSQVQDAELALRRDIASLQQLSSHYPPSAELDRAISQLQNLLNNLLQMDAELHHAPATSAAQADRWKQLSQEAQGTANRAAVITAKTTADLGGAPAAPAQHPSASHGHPPDERPATGLPHQGSPAPALPIPTVAPPPPPPTAKPVDRSPASVPPPAPKPKPTPAPTPGQSPVIVAPPPIVQSPQPTPTPASTRPDEMEWFNKLQNGLLQYSVPQIMLWKVPSTITVQVSGEKAPTPGPIDNQSGQASIKVARRMKVLVSAPDNPDEFTIAPESDTQLEQFVPEDGPTTWHFSVTPRYTASSQKLVVQAWVIYDANTQRELPVYQTVVNVHVPSLGECLKRLFEGDPDYWLKYGLPGGAGFIFVSGIVTALWKWLRRKKHPTPEPAGGH